MKTIGEPHVGDTLESANELKLENASESGSEDDSESGLEDDSEDLGKYELEDETKKARTKVRSEH